MSLKPLKISIFVELVNPNQYDEYNGELQQAIDQVVLRGTEDYVRQKRYIECAHNVTYSFVPSPNEQNLRLKVDFFVKYKKINWLVISEEIEYEIVPAE